MMVASLVARYQNESVLPGDKGDNGQLSTDPSLLRKGVRRK